MKDGIKLFWRCMMDIAGVVVVPLFFSVALYFLLRNAQPDTVVERGVKGGEVGSEAAREPAGPDGNR
jgi:hypothetical protein